jgi:membrane protease YdiL (CAAX protease family)
MLAKVKSRMEILVAGIGLLMYAMISQFSEVQFQPWVPFLVFGLATIYILLILWKPVRLPEKDKKPFNRQEVIKAGRVVLPAVLGAAGLNFILNLFSSTESGTSFGWFLVYLVVLVVLGSAGLAAECSLGIDLFPVLRRKELRWVIYVLAAALFLTLTQMFIDNLFSDLFEVIGQSFGDQPIDMADVASEFDYGSPLILLVNLVIGAGIFEELLFRVGIMTLVWGLARRWGVGLIVSAILFGVYHLSPISGIDSYLTAPVSVFLNSFTIGIFTGLVYRFRGFTTTVLMHSLGDWMMIMIFSGAIAS